MNKPAVRAGLIFGLLITALRLLDQGAIVVIELSGGSSTYDPQAAEQLSAYLLLLSLASLVLFFVYLGLYLWAGAVAARKTGSVGSGAIAGLVAALVASIIGTAVNIGLYVFGVLSLTGAATGGSTSIYGPDDTMLLTFVIVAAIFGMALDIGFGAGLGALGGLIGKSMYDKAHPNPYAGFPGFYPPPGMYPPPGAYVWYGPYPAPWYYPTPPGAPEAAPAPATPPSPPTSAPEAAPDTEQQSQPDGESAPPQP